MNESEMVCCVRLAFRMKNCTRFVGLIYDSSSFYRQMPINTHVREKKQRSFQQPKQLFLGFSLTHFGLLTERNDAQNRRMLII